MLSFHTHMNGNDCQGIEAGCQNCAGIREGKRKLIHLNATLIADGTAHPGMIENISENGLYMITRSPKSAYSFSSAQHLELRFHVSSGKIITLACKVQWAYKTPPHGLTDSLGIEISNPSQEYMKFFNSLY